jgi:hypothetical protein
VSKGDGQISVWECAQTGDALKLATMLISPPPSARPPYIADPDPSIGSVFDFEDQTVPDDQVVWIYARRFKNSDM